MLAISVPKPPRFVPTRSDEPFLVKAERSIAEGTLLITCEERIAVSVTFFSITLDRVSWITSILPRLPISTKKNTKVI